MFTLFALVHRKLKDGIAADLTYVNAVLESIAPIVKAGSLVVGKSTVPVGTAARLRDLLIL
jgi:UDPglucose 6-dehydrogenase